MDIVDKNSNRLYLKKKKNHIFPFHWSHSREIQGTLNRIQKIKSFAYLQIGEVLLEYQFENPMGNLNEKLRNPNNRCQ